MGINSSSKQTGSDKMECKNCPDAEKCDRKLELAIAGVTEWKCLHEFSLFDFYKDRLSVCPSYGFVSGHEILKTVTRCAFWDSTLTLDEFNSIINLAEQAHIKMMEDNYNDGWKDNQ